MENKRFSPSAVLKGQPKRPSKDKAWLGVIGLTLAGLGSSLFAPFDHIDAYGSRCPSNL